MQDQVAVISLELGAALLYWLVFVVLETTVLQFVNWGEFRPCLRASLFANLISGFVIALSLVWIPRLGFTGLVLGTLTAILIEAAVLMRLKPGARRQNWVAAIATNLTSFMILIFPVFWIARGLLQPK